MTSRIQGKLIAGVQEGRQNTSHQKNRHVLSGLTLAQKLPKKMLPPPEQGASLPASSLGDDERLTSPCLFVPYPKTGHVIKLWVWLL
jgi:hypothetical protein